MKKTFKSSSLWNISNFHNSSVWNPSKVQRSLLGPTARFLWIILSLNLSEIYICFLKFPEQHFSRTSINDSESLLDFVKNTRSSHCGCCNFIKKETLAQVFSCNFCEISKNTFYIKRLWLLLLKIRTIWIISATAELIFSLLEAYGLC